MSRSIVFRIKNISDETCSENRSTHFMISNLFRKSCHLWDNLEKYCWAGQTTGDNMAHAHFMLDT